jgi:soluble P-type ATPase
MIKVHIPGRGDLRIDTVLFDYNGTIATDGYLITGVKEKIKQYCDQVAFHVITADTFGFVKKQLEKVPCTLFIIPEKDQAQCKLDYLKELGPKTTLCVGNGANDEFILKSAGLGIAVLQKEGLATQTLLASDLLVNHILDVFDYFEKPGRLKASLRK